MAAAQHDVSGFLKDRHPYNEAAGFKERAARDQAKLFDGFGQPSFQYNIEALTNPDIAVGEKVKALKSLLAHLSSADAKIRAIQFRVVMSLKWLLERNLGSGVDELASLALRSLAVLPAGVFSVYHNDAVSCLITVVAGRIDQLADEAMLRAREAACEAIQQLAFGWPARWLLLGEDVPEGMLTSQLETFDAAHRDMAETKEDRIEIGHRVVDTLTHLITSYNADSGISQRLLLSALQSLVHLSAEPQGLDMCLMYGVLKEVDELLRKYAAAPAQWMGGSHTGVSRDVVCTAVSVVWNVCMDPVGKRKEEALTTLPRSLGRLLLAALQHPHQFARLKSALAGAIATIFVYEEAKSTSTAPLLTDGVDPSHFGLPEGNHEDVASALLRLLREGNGLVAALRGGRPVPRDPGETDQVARSNVEGMVKNSVQAIRLLTEMPSVRPRVVTLIGRDRELFLQLFKGTVVEQHMAAACGW
eukprot:EG_transcript_5033